MYNWIVWNYIPQQRKWKRQLTVNFKEGEFISIWHKPGTLYDQIRIIFPLSASVCKLLKIWGSHQYKDSIGGTIERCVEMYFVFTSWVCIRINMTGFRPPPCKTLCSLCRPKSNSKRYLPLPRSAKRSSLTSQVPSYWIVSMCLLTWTTHSELAHPDFSSPPQMNLEIKKKLLSIQSANPPNVIMTHIFGQLNIHG